MSLWSIRIFFLSLCVLGGYAVSQVSPEMISGGFIGVVIGFGFGGLLIAIDEMLKGFSLRTFSSVTFGLILGLILSWLIMASGLFVWAEPKEIWLIRLCLFLGLSYIGILLALRSNKEDFSLIIPYIRFAPQNQSEELLLLDTSVIIDGRIAELLEARFIEGAVVVPRFVLNELQKLSDSSDALKRGRGRRGLEMLERLQKTNGIRVKIHEADVAEEQETDGKLVKLARTLDAKLFTNDYNLARIAALQNVRCVSLTELSRVLKPVLAPGEQLELKLAREGKEKGQAVGYLPDGTLIVVNDAAHLIGKSVDVMIINQVQTGAGVIVFADLAARS